MAWRLTITERLADTLRFCARGALLINVILLAVASIYLVAKLIWYFLRYLDRTVFAHPW